jgi:hypothetical protein
MKFLLLQFRWLEAGAAGETLIRKEIDMLEDEYQSAYFSPSEQIEQRQVIYACFLVCMYVCMYV